MAFVLRHTLGGSALRDGTALRDKAPPAPVRIPRAVSESRRPLLVLKLRGPGRSWTTLGADEDRGIVPEGFNAVADITGPASCSFNLRRDPVLPRADLRAFAEADVEIGGMPVWGGRVWETPGTRGDERSLSVAGRGWFSHTEDDVIDKYWVQASMADWKDLRAHPDTNLAQVGTMPSIQAGRGSMTLGYPAAQWVQPNLVGDRCGFYIDMGTNRKAKKIVFDYESDGDNGNLQVLLLASDVKPYDVTGATLIIGLGGPSSGTVGFTLTTARRYVAVMGQNNSLAAQNPAKECFFKAKGIKIFVASGYESGGASILKASDVVRDVLGSGGLPLLSSSAELVTTSTFSIPHLAPEGRQSPRQILDAANAYHNWLLGVDAQRRLFFTPRPTTPLFEVGPWSGHDFSDQSTNSAENVYNRVIVQGQDASGGTIEVSRTAPSPLLDAAGITRTKVLQVSAVLNQASAEAIGDVWLSENARTQFKGSLKVTGMGAVRTVIGGRPVHPSELLLNCGQLLRFADLIDPDTGGQGRDGTIASVTYDHDTESASISLDNERGRLEALLQRIGALQAVAG